MPKLSNIKKAILDIIEENGGPVPLSVIGANKNVQQAKQCIPGKLRKYIDSTSTFLTCAIDSHLYVTTDEYPFKFQCYNKEKESTSTITMNHLFDKEEDNGDLSTTLINDAITTKGSTTSGLSYQLNQLLSCSNFIGTKKIKKGDEITKTVDEENYYDSLYGDDDDDDDDDISVFDLLDVYRGKLISSHDEKESRSLLTTKPLSSGALFGTLILNDDSSLSTASSTSTANNNNYEATAIANKPKQRQSIFLNCSQPFCAVAVGIQGAGKSYTTATLIESCMLNCPPIVSRGSSGKKMATFVAHYDTDEGNFCEAATLVLEQSITMVSGFPSPGTGAIQKAIILVSPSFYFQRKAYYNDMPNTKVYPLLFRWEDLTASHIKSLMRVKLGESSQLYMNVLLDILRSFQKKQKVPSFNHFKDILLSDRNFTVSQSSPLKQRLSLIESFLVGSKENDHLKDEDIINVMDAFEEGTIVIADLTDPMMSSEDANGVFQVVLNHFRSKKLDCGKLVVFDEAHKYLDSSTKDDLSKSIVEIVRQMRHYGMRLIVSSQSPKGLPPELLELSSMVIIHKFLSLDWSHHLASKIPLGGGVKSHETIQRLNCGQALVSCSNMSPDLQQHICDRYAGNNNNNDGGRCSSNFLIQIRQRITADGGSSRLHI